MVRPTLAGVSPPARRNSLPPVGEGCGDVQVEREAGPALDAFHETVKSYDTPGFGVFGNPVRQPGHVDGSTVRGRDVDHLDHLAIYCRHVFDALSSA